MHSVIRTHATSDHARTHAPRAVCTRVHTNVCVHVCEHACVFAYTHRCGRFAYDDVTCTYDDVTCTAFHVGRFAYEDVTCTYDDVAGCGGRGAYPPSHSAAQVLIVHRVA